MLLYVATIVSWNKDFRIDIDFAGTRFGSKQALEFWFLALILFFRNRGALSDSVDRQL